MSHALPVVRIRTTPTKGNPDGVVEINESDYDAAIHQLVDGKQPSLDLTGKKEPEAGKEAPPLAPPVPTEGATGDGWGGLKPPEQK